MDAGGVRKEFFLLIMKELLDPKYGMFRYYEESRLIWFSNKVNIFLALFRLHSPRTSLKYTLFIFLSTVGLCSMLSGCLYLVPADL